ncbi:hypothetical protein DAKH74_045520 [Maudiozyma humilis]|uniref:Uncharacterized protein n=1 Tax=Maudiozyma humilis TaxID=51915 RepID=A0AAV5S3D8_MAUHU|nr:hypothetical protein DAKH74_045520 [Kazachstania humilis]
MLRKESQWNGADHPNKHRISLKIILGKVFGAAVESLTILQLARTDEAEGAADWAFVFEDRSVLWDSMVL